MTFVYYFQPIHNNCYLSIWILGLEMNLLQLPFLCLGWRNPFFILSINQQKFLSKELDEVKFINYTRDHL